MLVLHAIWTKGALRLWSESLERYLAWKRSASAFAEHAVAAASPAAQSKAGQRTETETTTTTSQTSATEHPFAASAQELLNRLHDAGLLPENGDDPSPASPSVPFPLLDVIAPRLPRDQAGPWPSDRLARTAGGIESPTDPFLDAIEIPCVALPNHRALPLLLALEDRQPASRIELGGSMRFWIAVAKFITDLLANQRFIPTLIQSRDIGLIAAWQPWLHDEDARRRAAALLAAMPPVLRAMDDEHQGRPWAILDEAFRTLTDAAVRSALIKEHFFEAIEDRDPAHDPHVAWLAGLLGAQNQVTPPDDVALSLLRDAGQWVGRLNDTGQGRPLRLCLKLNEPLAPPELAANGQAKAKQRRATTSSTPDETLWKLSLHLQAADDHDLIIDAQHVWSHTSLGALLGDRHIEQPQELLLAELGRASRIYSKIESALSHQAPTEIELTTNEAYEFLHEVRPVLEESGFGVIVPTWWNQPLGRLGARLQIDAPPADALSSAAGDGIAPAASMIGLNSLVRFRWQVAIGDQPLTMEEFNALARQTTPLVHVRGRWIEISPQQLAAAREFLEKSPDGEMTLLEAIQMAHGMDDRQLGLPVFGLDASGWVADVLNASSEDHRMPQLEQPKEFLGTLRPYQATGLSWLAFLDRFGLGACLADDMGLGKTIQLIAMLLHEREAADKHNEHSDTVGPTLLIVPTSVVANWVRELQRFAPTIRVQVHHGPDRVLGDRFVEIAAEHDLVITTYPLISRDQETLRRVKWHRVALDEAQYIKNPPTKQTTAIRSLHAPRRLALTGTPVENRLSELWSIMEFLNPGYLGPSTEFRRRFAVPIERHRDPHKAEHLRQMVRPFILRRVKTDPTVIDDLPECLETKEYAVLTPEQAALYQQVVDAMLRDVDRAQGIQRRGLVLATLVKLKQICNHPAQFRNGNGNGSGNGQPNAELDDPADFVLPSNSAALSSRSGKARRMITMLEEVLATGEKALIFTQFRQMGHLLTAMIQHDLDCEALFLHGGTPAAKRQHLIDRFQAPDGGAPVFVLSLKAGGVGLNLTAANHVFHFDRWWNPAVENQATDRAFRIGQTRTVHVHKFVCVGTLEERIDQMIEQKTELAQNIIGSGEQWLTELSTSQLHELLMLRTSAMEADS